jgi:hypothetical protein
VSDDFSVEIGEDGIPIGEKYDIGRIRLLASVIGSSFKDKQTNLLNIISMNDDGIKKLNDMYEQYAAEYEASTGQKLYMTKEEFIDMVRNNLHNQIKELAILGALIGLMLSLGFMAPDDEEDKATKNFHRFALKTVDKFVSELSFFYNPVNYQSLLDQGIFPATGIIVDFGRFVDHLWMETTGLDMKLDTSKEDVRKKAQPIKNAMKMLPFTKSLVTYLAIFDSDFAKDHMTFGMMKKNVLYISIVNRHPIDILRTVSHEFIHYKQLMDGKKITSHPGSPAENQANAKAGEIMRKYGRLHPELFDLMPLR